MSLLEVDSVQLSFEGRKILSNVYLSCATTEIVGLLGRNGAGKSSLLKIIFGSLKGESQTVRLNKTYSPQLFRVPNAVHYMPQDGFVMDYFSFDDLINIFQLQAHLDKIFELKEIKKNRKKRVGSLSGGEKKLMEIITLLYSKSEFVILDEPFSYLSPILIEKLIPHLHYQAQTKGIILTDHQYETVFQACNKYYVLNQGIINQVQQVSELAAFGYIRQ